MGSIGSRGLSVVSSLVLHFLLAAFLGPTDYGFFAVAFAAGQLGSIIAKGGYDVQALRSMSTANTARERRRSLDWLVTGLVRRWIPFVVVTTIISVLVEVPIDVIGAAQVLVVTFILQRFSESVLRSMERTSLAGAVVLAGNTSAIFLAVVPRATAWWTVGALASTSVVLAAGSYVDARRGLAAKRGGDDPVDQTEPAPRRQVHLIGLTGIMGALIGQSDTLIVERISGFEAAGTYSLGWRMGAGVGLGLLLVNFAFGGEVGRAAVRGDRAQLQALADRMSRWSLSTALLLLPAVGVASWIVLRTLVTTDDAALVFGFLVASSLVNVAGGPLVLMLNLDRAAGSLLACMTSAAVLNVSLSIVLGLRYGPPGVALGTLAGQLWLSVIGMVVARRRLGTWVGIATLPAVRRLVSRQAR